MKNLYDYDIIFHKFGKGSSSVCFTGGQVCINEIAAKAVIPVDYGSKILGLIAEMEKVESFEII